MTPEEQAAAAEALGMSPEELNAFAGAVGTEDQVYLGSKRVKYDNRGKTPWSKTGNIMGKVSKLAKGETIEPDVGFEDIDDTVSVTEKYKDLYRIVRGELPSLQRRLFAGGFYNRSLSWEDIRSGDYDAETEQAYQRAIDRAAAFYGAGVKKTLDEVIDESAQYDPITGEPLGGGSGGGSGGDRGRRESWEISQTHPDDIRTVAMRISTKTLGRGWNADELDRFVQTYQSMEREAQAFSGGTEAPSMEAAAERAAREANPVAAEGADMAGAYKLMVEAMQQLGGG